MLGNRRVFFYMFVNPLFTVFACRVASIRSLVDTTLLTKVGKLK
jgi:hypothetical protein